ncbi:serine/threonine-protein kinase [Skermania sp. ID1734]|uniref:serine/threonine-protein kinase n=1 Tax=Skermania sp. ID1734 TaxID=2597516 RepID=UPI00351B1604
MTMSSNADDATARPGEATVAPTATVGAEFDATLAPTVGPRTIAAITPNTDPLESIDVGQCLDDFDLLTPLGAGAFARVFLARQRTMQRLVAVKVSENHGTEPQTLAQLDHDYIVRVFDQRILDDRRLRLLYMQYLPGGTLLNVLQRVRATPIEQRSGALLLASVDAAMASRGEIRPSDSSVRTEIAGLNWPDTVAWLGRRLAEALDYAGERGVLHRDVKPANVLLTSEGVPKLADFNISFSGSVTGADGRRSSPVAYFGGSLSYMSPEQLEACHPGRSGTAADLDTRSDIYSLGVLLWELLTGRKPFDDGDIVGGDTTTLDAMLSRRHGGITEQSIERLPPNCSAALRRVLLTCLAANPAERWPTGAALAQQFEVCLDARACDLVDPPAHSWRLRLRRWTVPIVTLAIAVPNALAALYNIQQNQMLVVTKLKLDAQRTFDLIAAFNNIVAFALGGLLILYLCRRLLIVPRGLRLGRTYDAETLAAARRDTLLMGDRIVAVCFGLWMIFGIFWPIGLQVAAGRIPPNAWVHFVAAQVVCGAIAVAYPFILIMFFAIRCLYPTFLPHGETSATDARLLRGLDRRGSLYLAIAASVPLLGVAGLTFVPTDEIPLVIVAVRIVCLGGTIAFVVAYRVFRAFEADLQALDRVVSA